MTGLLWLLAPAAILAAAGLAIGWHISNHIHPAQASTPGPGTSPVPGHPHPGEGQPPPVLHAPAPALYGKHLMSSDFYDTGIVITHDHVRNRTVVWLPPVDDGALEELLSEGDSHGL